MRVVKNFKKEIEFYNDEGEWLSFEVDFFVEYKYCIYERGYVFNSLIISTINNSQHSEYKEKIYTILHKQF